jgi:hypothetical protein
VTEEKCKGCGQPLPNGAAICPTCGLAPRRGESGLSNALGAVYERLQKGVPGLLTPETMAKKYLRRMQQPPGYDADWWDGESRWQDWEGWSHYEEWADSLDKAIDWMIRWQCRKSGVVGFSTSFGGVVLLPANILADLGTTAANDVRMIAAVACMRGYDLKSDEVKTAAATCYLAEMGREPVKTAGIAVGKKQAKRTIERIPTKSITAINRKLGGRIISKAGKTTPITLVKGIPVAGGAAGAAIDYSGTRALALVAKRAFPPRTARTR